MQDGVEEGRRGFRGAAGFLHRAGAQHLLHGHLCRPASFTPYVPCFLIASALVCRAAHLASNCTCLKGAGPPIVLFPPHSSPERMRCSSASFKYNFNTTRRVLLKSALQPIEAADVSVPFRGSSKCRVCRQHPTKCLCGVSGCFHPALGTRRPALSPSLCRSWTFRRKGRVRSAASVLTSGSSYLAWCF